MARPTIKDLAKAADVSVATVNRVIGGTGDVRGPTMRRVRDAALAIGFYGLSAIENRIGAAQPKYRFGILLQQPNRTFYKDLAGALKEAASRAFDAKVEVQIEFLEELSPQNIAAQMMTLGEKCDAISVVAAVHPMVTQAVEDLQRRGVPVFALISQLAATGEVHYVGLDNWKVGRTSAWAFKHICKTPGKLGILVGNHRYRCQEMNESGFRSDFREFASGFVLLEPLTTFESSVVAQEMTERLLRENPDLAGLYVAGGGISGALTALRASDRAGKIVVVGYQLMDNTRAALLDGTLTMVISHPLPRLSDELIQGMIRACDEKAGSRTYTSVLPFDIYTRENI
jgi:LacI family transcriptional regulator